MNSPFDETRYRGLLEGLEVTVQALSDVLADNRVFRFDSQFFAKTALHIEAKLKTGIWCELKDAAGKIESFGAYALTNEFSYVEEGIPFLRCMNIRQGFTDFSDVLYITETANKLLSKSEIQPGMVLLTMSGSVGNASVALPSWHYPINSNQDIAKITPNIGVNGFYLAAFLSSNYGRAQMERLPIGSVQQHIFLWMIEKLIIQRFSETTEAAIGKALSDAYCLEQASVTKIKEAEQALLHALGLENWQPPEPLTYTRSSLDAFAAGRLDAEYFQPKYEAAIAVMRKHENDFRLVNLKDISGPLKYGCSEQLDYCEEGRIFLRIADLENKRFNMNSVLHVPVNTSFRDSDIVQENDVLISRSGTLGVAVPVTSEFSGATYGSYFIRTRPDTKIIHPEFLALFMNSFAGQIQVEGSNTGGIQTNLTIPAIENLWIPLGDMSWQLQFVEYIEQAHSSRRRAAQLLDAAKRAVEIAIEDSEAAALAYLESFHTA